ncbi:MAG: ABC transporter ATP-binding protein, partial [Eubacterium sp.]|nr:ABC transporter ATP-binding protein [Eubacterium sp.]
GESGCGKSTVGRLLVGIEKPTSGEILYRGQDLVHMSGKNIGAIRTELQMIFQDSYSSLNPRKRVYDILSEPMLYHKLADRSTVDARVDELLEEVGLPKNAKRRYPHEFSGGQRQRISIARALSLNPSLIVCDEPVSALDMSIQAQILNLLKDLQDRLGVTYLFIAHGLGAVHYVSQRIAVMYLGQIVEMGESDEVFRHPVHPYSRALISAVPVADPSRHVLDHVLAEGEVPSPIDLPEGCRFAGRCPYATDRCRREQPLPVNVAAAKEPEHLVACFEAERLLAEKRAEAAGKRKEGVQ